MPKPPLPAKKVKDKIIPFRVSIEDRKKIHSLMKSYNLSTSDLIRKGIEDLEKAIDKISAIKK